MLGYYGEFMECWEGCYIRLVVCHLELWTKNVFICTSQSLWFFIVGTDCVLLLTDAIGAWCQLIFAWCQYIFAWCLFLQWFSQSSLFLIGMVDSSLVKRRICLVDWISLCWLLPSKVWYMDAVCDFRLHQGSWFRCHEK